MPGLHRDQEAATKPCLAHSTKPVSLEVGSHIEKHKARSNKIHLWLAANQHLQPTPAIYLLKRSRRKEGLSIFIVHPPAFGRVDEKDDEQVTFFVEWLNKTGPQRSEMVPPAVPFEPRLEFKRFPSLFQRTTVESIGCAMTTCRDVQPYTPVSHSSFEDYVVRNLQSHNRFKLNAQWLFWVLTRTEDKALAAMVNCVLAIFHDCKARHLGSAKLEISNLKRPFQLKELVDGKLVAKS